MLDSFPRKVSFEFLPLWVDSMNVEKCLLKSLLF